MITTLKWRQTGFTCYECNGTGDGGIEIIKEYTPEYEQKLEARRAKAEAKKREKHDAEIDSIRAKWLEAHGFDPEGFTYVFLGNTYEMKEEIKEVGGKFDHNIGWHIAIPVDGLKTVKVGGILAETNFGYQTITLVALQGAAKEL